MHKGNVDKSEMTMSEWIYEWNKITSYLRSLKCNRINQMPIVPDKASIQYEYYKRDQRRKEDL